MNVPVALQAILEDAQESFGLPASQIGDARRVGGGCIADAWRISTDAGDFFLKTHPDDGQDMFMREAAGLSALAGGIRSPEVHAFGSVSGQEYLLLEWLDLSRGREQALGEQLAALHAIEQPAFGFLQDNFIGAMPQINGFDDHWPRFYREKRLTPQLKWAKERGLPSKAIAEIEALCEQLEVFFTDYQPTPAMIHGDMWGANHGFLADGTPVLFDPATYCADREAEIAMTELFGGLTTGFYHAYQAHTPLDAGYATRKTLYNLYHVLNHFNLFGGGYGQQAEKMAARLNATARG